MVVTAERLHPAPPKQEQEQPELPTIYFSERKRLIQLNGQKITFKPGNSWDVFLYLLKHSAEHPLEPISPTTIKGEVNQSRDHLQIIDSLTISRRQIHSRIEENPRKPTILVIEGTSSTSTWTLRAYTLPLDLPDEKDEEQKFPFTIPPEAIELPERPKKTKLNDDYEKKAARLKDRLNQVREDLNLQLVTILLSRFKDSLAIGQTTLAKNPSSLLQTSCPDFYELYYENPLTKKWFLQAITGYEEGRPERGSYIIYTLSETLKFYSNLQKRSGQIHQTPRTFKIIEDINFLQKKGVTIGQMVYETARYYGIETPPEYKGAEPHPRMNIVNIESGGYRQARGSKLDRANY